MQKISKPSEDSGSEVDLCDVRVLHPISQVSKRIVLYLCFLSLWLTVLVAIVTLNEWFALLIQGLALSGSLLPLVRDRDGSVLSGARVELAEGSEQCAAMKTAKR